LPSNLTTRILTLFLPTPGRRIAQFIILLQEKIWRRWPNLTLKLSDFIPIGGVTNILQGTLFILLLSIEVEVFVAISISVLLSALFNFVANRKFTWRHEFISLTRKHNALWFIPLFIIFCVFTPTVPLKIAGISSFDFFYHISPEISWFIFSGIGLIANFFGAELISFGIITRIIRRITLGQEIQSHSKPIEPTEERLT